MRGRRRERVAFLLRAAIAFAVFTLQPLTASAAPILVGDSVQGILGGSGIVVTPFTSSPEVVGAGIEFTGAIRDPGKGGSLWNVWVDISASSFTIRWTSSNPYAFIAGGPLVTLTLTDLDFSPSAVITSVTRTGYNCTLAGVICDNGVPADQGLLATPNAIGVTFHALRSGEIYTFDIATRETTTPAPVPEPTSMALLGTGVATVIAGRYRRRRAGVSN